MFRRFVSLLMALPFFGCDSKSASQSPEEANQEHRVQVRMGGSDADAAKNLPFTIVAVHQNRKPIDTPPFHELGGEWTFYDCLAEDQTTFVVGIVTKTTDTAKRSMWGKAILAVSDNESGRKFAELFARCFGGIVPPASGNPQPPKPLFLNTAILGEDCRRDLDEGFTLGGGGWTATKWFPSNDLTEAEVYFNFNLHQAIGEFSEKDSDYANDLVAIWAAALRDGPRPPRTPENDPNLSLVGPTIGPARRLLERRTSLSTFSSNSRYAVYQQSKNILAVSVADAGQEPVKLAEFDYSPSQLHLINDDLELLVQESVQQELGVERSDDPKRIWWITPATKGKQLLRGPETGIGLPEKPLSPDARFVVLDQWMSDANRKIRTKVIHILDRTSGMTITVQLPKKDLYFVGWTHTTAGLRAVGVTNRWGFDKDQPSESFLIDPTTGKMEPQAQPQLDPNEALLSPDGKHHVRIGDDEILVTSLESIETSRFSFHEEDRPFVGKACIEWLSPDYLLFKAPKLALIDVRTMKMNFPATADGGRFHSGAYTFSPDFHWVLYQSEGSDGEGLFLAPIQLPIE